MKISGSINKQITEAMKAKDAVRLSTLRLLSSELNYERIAKQKDLSEEDELKVVRREVKRRQEAIVEYEKVNAQERAEKERLELAILKEFLPRELTEEEIGEIVDSTIAEINAKGREDFGKVMGVVMKKLAGSVDGSQVAEIVKPRLSKNDKN